MTPFPKRLTTLVATCILSGFPLAAVVAAGDVDDPTTDEMYSDALDAIENAQYGKAVRYLKDVVQDRRNDPDVWNWLGFAARHNAQFDLSWDAYDRALSIDPTHLGALNYLGHLYITRGDMSGANDMLDRLSAACDACDEYEDLAAAIASAR